MREPVGRQLGGGVTEGVCGKTAGGRCDCVRESACGKMVRRKCGCVREYVHGETGESV